MTPFGSVTTPEITPVTPWLQAKAAIPERSSHHRKPPINADKRSFETDGAPMFIWPIG